MIHFRLTDRVDRTRARSVLAEPESRLKKNGRSYNTNAQGCQVDTNKAKSHKMGQIWLFLSDLNFGSPSQNVLKSLSDFRFVPFETNLSYLGPNS